MKKLLCFFLVILVLVSPALAADGSTLVYTTRTGECYHRYSCSSLSKSCYETTLSQAVADGYRPCGRCHPPTLDSGSSSAKPSLSDRIAANNSSGSSSGSSYSGYSSGSSSYSSGYSSGRSSSRASVSSSRSAERVGETVKTIALFVFVYPPWCIFTWNFVILLIKSILRKRSNPKSSEVSVTPPVKNKKTAKAKKEDKDDRFPIFFLIGLVPLAMWFFGLIVRTNEIAYWLIDDVLPRSFFDGPLNNEYLVNLLVEIAWFLPVLCLFEILNGKHFIRLPVARVYRVLYFAYSIAGASLFVTRGDVTPLHWVLFAVLCAASLAWSIWHWIESESFPVEKDD